MAEDLLIAAAIDFEDTGRLAEREPHMAAAMRLGRAGSLRTARVDGAWLAARAGAEEAHSPIHSQRQWIPHAGPDGAVTLMAGRLHDEADIRLAHGLSNDLSGTALYAALYARLGEACDKAIYGDYSVIQWHPQRKWARLARSPTSFQPLHYWRDGSCIVVGSIPRVLFSGGLRPAIDDTKLGDALLLNPLDPVRSWYRCARRVATGTRVRIDRNSEHAHRFWTVEGVGDTRFARDEDYVEATEEKMRRAVRAELHDVARPAIALSGGLDSQAVTAFMAEFYGPEVPLVSFTGVPQAGWQEREGAASFGNEADHVRSLAAMYPQIEPHFVTGADQSFGDQLAAIHLLGSWPSRNETNMHWIHSAYAAAKSAGCDALVSGALGNSGFSYDGLTGYATWLAEGRLGLLARELRASSDPRPAWRRFISLALMPHLPHALRRAIDRPRHWRVSPFASWCPMREDFAHASGALERARHLGTDLDGYDVPTSREWRAAVLADTFSEAGEIELGLRLHHGLAAREPTAYQPLLELCIGMPDEQYLRGGTDRWLARRLLEGRVPELVRAERRTGRQAADWALRFVRERGALRAELEAMQADPWMAERIDTERLIADLDAWDGSDDPSKRNPERIRAAIGRGISTARFIRYVEGRNVGT